jgi:hypothetical protein
MFVASSPTTVTAEPSSASSPAAADMANITAGYGDSTAPAPKIKRARHRDAGATTTLARDGCMANPAQCKCASKDPHKIAICQPMIGYFCPESTLNLMASMCIELFGGVTACRCATSSELQSHVDGEAKKSKKKKKKKKSKKK